MASASEIEFNVLTDFVGQNDDVASGQRIWLMTQADL